VPRLLFRRCRQESCNVDELIELVDLRRIVFDCGKCVLESCLSSLRIDQEPGFHPDDTKETIGLGRTETGRLEFRLDRIENVLAAWGSTSPKNAAMWIWTSLLSVGRQARTRLTTLSMSG